MPTLKAQPKPKRKRQSKFPTNSQVKSLPPRDKVKPEDRWDLASLFDSDADWEKAFDQWSRAISGYEKFRGKLGKSSKTLSACLNFDSSIDRAGERLGTYAYLRASEDQANSDAQRMKGRYEHVAAKAAEASSWIRPELMDIPASKMSTFLRSKELVPWKLALERILRYRPHTLGKKEENLLAMQGPMSDASNQIFRQLNDADLKWGLVKNEKGELVELGHSSFSAFLHSPKRSVRKEAFHEYYKQFDAHKNTIAASLNGSVQRDVYYAKARGYESALKGALFADNVPVSVYDSLIASVHKNLPAVYRYYDLRKRKMNLPDIHQYDTYVPILSDLDKRHTWEQAVTAVVDSLAPLGDEYCRELQRGMTSARWCDRFPAIASPIRASRAAHSAPAASTASPTSS